MQTVIERYADILGTLERSGARIRRTSPTTAMAQCPAHADREPSLSIRVGDKTVLIHCHAGCEPADILDVLGLRYSHLWPDDGTIRPATRTAWKAYQAAVNQLNNRDHQRPPSSPTIPEKATTRRGPCSHKYVYTDADAVPIAQKLRIPLIDITTGEIVSKTFVWQRYADGEWIDKLDGTNVPIYNLPAVISGVQRHIPIWIVEGEKDADRLNALNLIATTLHSTNAVDIERLRPLTGADITLIVDRDTTGDTWARELGDALTSLGCRLTYRKAAVGKDVSDHLDAGHTLDQLLPYTINDDTSDVDVKGDNPDIEPDDDNTWLPQPILTITARQANETPPDILTRSDNHGTFYRGRVNGIIGEAESGKTWIAIAAAAEQLRQHHPVIWIDFEDTPGAALKRLRYFGITDQQLAHFHYIQPMESPAQTQRHAMLNAIHKLNPTVVIVDGFNAGMTLMGLDINSNNDATVFFTRILTPMTQRGDGQLGPAVIYIDHISKSKDRGRGALGAQAKRAMTSGTCLLIKVKDYPAPGKNGTLKTYVDKDRPGLVRQHATQDYLGAITLNSLPDGDDYSIEFKFFADGQPDPDDEDRERADRISDEQRMETIMRRRHEDINADGTRPARSQRFVEDQVGGNHRKTRDLLRQLKAAGFLDADHRWLRAFTWGTGQI